MIKRALLSVSDKSGLLKLAEALVDNDIEIISTGGTYTFLSEKGFDVTEVKDITQFPEILDGRVKTLHPNIHAGILAKRNNSAHLQTLVEHNISQIDFVIVNLYPFLENADNNLSDEELVEFIDIGGPTMLRAAAKSFTDVVVISNVEEYESFMRKLYDNDFTLEYRRYLAGKVFNFTAAYDAAIAKKLLNESFPDYFTSSYKKVMDLRYGENPHQKASFYTTTVGTGALKDFVQHQGKELSFNNIRDLEVAWKVVNEFEDTCCCAVKHATPCGVALDSNIVQAYQKTHDCDPISIFGGIVAFNDEVSYEVAEKLNEIFLEIVVAPAFSTSALALFKQKKNLRIIEIKNPISDEIQAVQVDGGLLVQEIDYSFSENLEVVTKSQPTDSQREDMIFAQKIIKHVKSNAIIIASDLQTVGVGTGQTNRIWAAQHAITQAKQKNKDSLVLASDAFFPFRDVVDFAAQEGISAIIQPGGSIKDNDSIQAADEHNIAMIFTGMRHFLH